MSKDNKMCLRRNTARGPVKQSNGRRCYGRGYAVRPQIRRGLPWGPIVYRYFKKDNSWHFAPGLGGHLNGGPWGSSAAVYKEDRSHSDVQPRK